MFSRLGQFFANNTSVLAPEAVTAFEQLGMPKTANMLRASIQFFGTLYPRDRVIREQRITRAVWGDAIPQLELEDSMAVEIEEENGGFWHAANNYAQER